MLNSEFMANNAKALASQLQSTSENDEGRVRAAFERLYCREPNEREMQVAVEYLNAEDENEKLTRWERYAQVLLGANEFMYVD